METDERDLSLWKKNRIKVDQIKKYKKENGDSFINQNLIESLLAKKRKISKKEVEDILEKSLTIEALTLEETAKLLSVENKNLLSLMEEAAFKIKKKVYDNRFLPIKLVAPVIKIFIFFPNDIALKYGHNLQQYPCPMIVS